MLRKAGHVDRRISSTVPESHLLLVSLKYQYYFIYLRIMYVASPGSSVINHTVVAWLNTHYSLTEAECLIRRILIRILLNYL